MLINFGFQKEEEVVARMVEAAPMEARVAVPMVAKEAIRRAVAEITVDRADTQTAGKNFSLSLLDYNRITIWILFEF